MIVYPSKMYGNVAIPPSKSVAHRAIIAASLTKSRCVITNIDLSSDIKATIQACKALGSRIEVKECSTYNAVIVDGGLSIDNSAEIDCAESGSTLRFMIPIACAASGKKVFTGSGRLPERPIDAYYDIFNRDGVAYLKPQGVNLPLSIEGKLTGGDYVIDGSVSSQYITGLLFALPLLEADSTITIINNFESKGYVDITLSVLKDFGIEIHAEENKFYIKGSQNYSCRDYDVEGDFSQAAFFLVGGCISGDISIRGLKEDSLQPDRAIVDILRCMGADIKYTCDGLRAKKSQLNGIDVDVSQCPDLVPPIAVAAAFAKGKTNITGAARLRIKESDRLAAVSTNLNNLGIRTELREDGMTIYGGSIKAGSVDSFNDHRITMAFAVAAMQSDGEVIISGEESINKSYPKFFEDYEKAGGTIG